MAVTRTFPPHESLAFFQLDEAMLETPAARRAWQAGLLEAKRQAMTRAARLALWGRPLLVAVIGVSFLHLWDTIASIKPDAVPSLDVPAWLHHTTAAAQTLAIDAAAFFCVAATGAAAFAGAKTGKRYGVLFFLTLTFLLNAAFIVRYAPALPADVRSTILPILDLLFVIMLPLFIPVAIFSVEHATHLVETARLKLLVEVTALEELTRNPKSEKGRGSQNGRSASGKSDDLADLLADDPNTESPDTSTDPLNGGRRKVYVLADLQRIAAPGEEVTPAGLMAELKCSKTTLNELLQEAIQAGSFQKTGHGRYVRV